MDVTQELNALIELGLFQKVTRHGKVIGYLISKDLIQELGRTKLKLISTKEKSNGKAKQCE